MKTRQITPSPLTISSSSNRPEKHSNNNIKTCCFGRNFSLRVKTTFVLIIMFLGLMALCLGILLAAFFVVFQNVEYQQAKEASKRVSRALLDDLNYLQSKVFEFGAFDDTVSVYENLTQENIGNYTEMYWHCVYLNSVNVNMAFLYSKDGTLITKVHCFKGQMIEQVPDEFSSLEKNSYGNFFLQDIENVWSRKSGILIPKKTIFEMATSDESRNFLSSYESNVTNIVLVAAMPVQSTNYDYSRGLVLFAKYQLDEHALDMAERTQLCMTMMNLKNETDLYSFKESIGSLDTNAFSSGTDWKVTNITTSSYLTDWIDNESSLVQFLDSSEENSVKLNNRQCWKDNMNDESSVSFNAGSPTDRMASYQAFYTLDGEKSLIIRSDIPRKTFQIGMASFLVVWSVMTFMIVVMSIAIVCFVEMIVLRRVISLSSTVQRVHDTVNYAIRAPKLGNDELGQLSKDLNTMLGEIEHVQNQLEKDNTVMQDLLEKTALEEAKSRCVMNSIDDFIVTVDCSNGMLLNINLSFESRILRKQRASVNFEALPFNQAVFAYFKEIPSLELLLQKLENLATTGSHWETTILSGFGLNIPVHVTAKRIKVIMGKFTRVDAYMIVARNLSDQNEMKQTIKNKQDKLDEMKQHSDFDRYMTDPILRQQFKEFCTKERAEENVIFLEQVMEYKKLSRTHERAKKQKEIIEMFLSENSATPINISKQVFTTEVKKILEGFGQLQLFDNLETIIKSMLILDKFKRFISQFETSQMTTIDTDNMSSSGSIASDASYQHTFTSTD
ncbi:predicted protein [Naegleria gruberi]|uniref:Predicted protein n=1 Tax=Naegleria gruberi TaxID=5762 RepID=D2W2R3_NAEGR|nr:uncharacterized protein NAEGRDRAFT_54250 [Naegleria gruberi]EFC36662.1 predicted protein [Naegleria gruberi]|eukprot:XP_002669406.1 predicted protein [Naegleria gruberi strain NEG-M]